ncbi:hypothetical protein BG003_001545, partial [Podila horticola]
MHHRDETHQNLNRAHDPETFSHQHRSLDITRPSPLPSKRGPSRSPSPANQVAPSQSTGHTTFRRTVSSPQLPRMPSNSLLPDLRALPSSPRAGLSNFIQYRESRIGSPSVSSRSPSHSSRNHVLPSATSRRNLPQASSGPLYSQTPQPHSQDTPASLIQRRQALRASHVANNHWYRLYESLEFGTLPFPEECANAPPSQQPLAKIPFLKNSRKKSVLGHFYTSLSETEFQCAVKDKTEAVCGKVFKKSGGGKTRLNHVINNHSELYDALKEFRTYQCSVQAIELPVDPDEFDAPSTPKRSRFEAVRDEFIMSNMKQPLAYEQQTFVDLLLKLITVRDAPFALIDSDEFRTLCGLLNPLFTVPSTASLQHSLDLNVRGSRQKVQAYISQNVHRGSITADSWMAIDKRKFLGITYHFLTPTFMLASVVIGMERIVGPQTSETLFSTI